MGWINSFRELEARAMPLGQPRTAMRNLELFMAATAGASVEAIAERFNLSVARVHTILIAERHKVAVSPDPIYRALRQKHLAT
jgi:hypothetical protein